jgi:hypothetical protein
VGFLTNQLRFWLSEWGALMSKRLFYRYNNNLNLRFRLFIAQYSLLVEFSKMFSKKNATWTDKTTSMNTLLREETAQTPYIHFDESSGIMEIRGRSIPDNSDEFWMPILNWFESYLLNPCENTTFRINLEYFNITSSKRILFLLYKLNELAEAGSDVNVEWYYRESDEDMYEVGQDYAYMVRVPFSFEAYPEFDLAIA